LNLIDFLDFVSIFHTTEDAKVVNSKDL